MKIRKNIQSRYILLIGEGEKNTMFLVMILIDLCMIIHCIAEENIFVVIV